MENNEPIRDQEIEIDLVALFSRISEALEGTCGINGASCSSIWIILQDYFCTGVWGISRDVCTDQVYFHHQSADIQVGSSLTNDYEYVITGRTVLSQVIDNLDMDETYEQLSKRVSIENPTDTRVLKIVVTDTDLEASKTVADEIAKVSSQYIADNMDQSQPKIIQTAYASKTPVEIINILKKYKLSVQYSDCSLQPV